MSVEVRNDVSNVPFIRMGMPAAVQREAETVAQDAGRTSDMVAKTLMSYDPAAGKWVPFTDETGTDGTQFPRGVLLKTLAEADIVAGDIDNVPILVGACILDRDQLVIENSKTLATVINSPAGVNITVEDHLRTLGLYMESTVDVDGLENS